MKCEGCGKRPHVQTINIDIRGGKNKELKMCRDCFKHVCFLLKDRICEECFSKVVLNVSLCIKCDIDIMNYVKALSDYHKNRRDNVE